MCWNLPTEQQEVTNRKFVILTLAAAIISLLHGEKKMADVECLQILLDAGGEKYFEFILPLLTKIE
jgi:hypothetical protein